MMLRGKILFKINIKNRRITYFIGTLDSSEFNFIEFDPTSSKLILLCFSLS